MTKYKMKKGFVDKDIFADAETYKEGMEDGFEFYDLQGKFICYMSKEDVKTKPYPKANRVPVIVNGNKFPIEKGDFIVTFSNGDRYPVSPLGFELVYEKVEEEGSDNIDHL